MVTWRKSVQIGMIVFLLTAMAMPIIAGAQLPVPQPQVSGNALDLTEIENIIRKIAQFLIAIAIIVAVIAIIWGGIVYMTAGGSEERAKSGKSFMIKGIIGALIVMAIGVILQTLASIVARSFFF